AFHSDAKYFNSFSKLIPYEGFLQREFSRVLRELYMMQDERRARLAEAEPRSPRPASRKPLRPPQTRKKRVAVGIAVARSPPHRSVRADFPHTAPTLDEWRQSGHSDTDARCGRWESTGAPVGPCAPNRYGYAGSDGVTSAANTG